MKEINLKRPRSKVRLFIRIFLGVTMAIVFVTVSLQIYVKNSTKGYILSAEEASRLQDVDCILVLGAGVRDDKPSPMLRDRLEMGIELYHNKTAPKLLMSGDHGREGYNEVSVMKHYAMDKGVPSEDIFMDHAGFSTYESAIRALNVFGVKKVVIVTQSYHLFRAVYDARALGMEAYGVSTTYDYTGYGQFMRDTREVAARVKDVFYCMVKPKSTYEGEMIFIGGDGNQTNDKDDF